MSTDPNETDNSLLPGGEPNEADSVWEAGKSEAKKTNPVGQFQVKIEKAELGRSNSSGRLQIHYELAVVTGDAAGSTLHKYDGLGTAKQASITQQQLTRIGVDLEGVNMSKLPAVLADIVGRVVAVQARQNGDFYNIYFNRAVDTAVGSDGAPAKGDGARFYATRPQADGLLRSLLGSRAPDLA
jgi:hypothetical protein